VHHACAVVHPSAVTAPAVQRSGPPCASAFSITCRTPSWCVAACGGLHVSVLHPTRRTHARTTKRVAVAFRGIFRPFRTPKIRVGGWPSPGFAVLQLALVWQAKKAVAEKKAAEEFEKVRFLPTLDVFGLRRTCKRHVPMR
jgi:hypothetical protein